jgi:hypothetical protein
MPRRKEKEKDYNKIAGGIQAGFTHGFVRT